MISFHFSVLLVLGIALSGGILGAWFFQKLRIPQVIGYIAIGIAIGETGLGIVTQEQIENLQPANLFALGIIGFLVGGELKIETFRKYAKQFTVILLGEGLAAFFLVGVPCTLFLNMVTGDFMMSLAGGIVFGAISSATDPASTISVLWEYRSKGVLTTSIVAIVALDDALAMTLYGLGTSAAQILAGGASNLGHELVGIGIELGGAVVVGALLGLGLSLLLRRIREPEKANVTAISAILLDIGLSRALGLDVILSAMTVGFVLANIDPRRSEDLFGIVRSFSLPIYVFFFVLVGARLVLGQMPGWLWGIVAIYVVGRSVGKMAGAYLGARVTGAEPVVQRYLGMGLLAQGGVAIGLSMMAGERLESLTVPGGMPLSHVIVFVVTATTLIVQVIGPPMVKLASKLSGELGRDVREEDVIDSWKVRDVMYVDTMSMPRGITVSQAMKLFAEHDFLSYPVVDSQNQVAGVISLDDLKEVLGEQSTWDWLVVADVMAPVLDKVTPETPLADALDLMQKLKIQRMPVVKTEEDDTLVGMLSLWHIEARVSHELVLRQGAVAAAAPQ